MPIGEPPYYILVRSRDGRARPGGLTPTDRVFLRPAGMPWSEGAVEAHLMAALKAAKIEPPLRFHDLRHTCSSRLKRKGLDPVDIQELLGHKSMITTRGYFQIRIEEPRRTVNLLMPSTNLTQETEPDNHLFFRTNSPPGTSMTFD